MTRLAAIVIAGLAVGGCGDPDPTWHTADLSLDRAALAVTGVADDDVWVAGGPLGSTGTALALHYDGSTWRDEGTTLGGVTLWWVWVAPDGNDVWFVGEQGTIARWNGAEMTTMTSPTTSTLFGVWGSGSDDVWIVGGDPVGGGDDDIVLHYDGQTLTQETVPVRGAALFKVWGEGDEVFVSGQAGTMLHKTATGWADRSMEIDSVSPLFTVHGCSLDEVYAVGGRDIYRYDGSAWTRLPEPEIFGFANGIACGEAGVLAVGNAAIKWRYDRETQVWHDDQFSVPSDQDLHGAWVSPSGEFWAVGGNFNLPAGAPRVGRIGRYSSAAF